MVKPSMRAHYSSEKARVRALKPKFTSKFWLKLVHEVFFLLRREISALVRAASCSRAVRRRPRLEMWPALRAEICSLPSSS